jgi:hypothetical protein
MKVRKEKKISVGSELFWKLMRDRNGRGLKCK